MRAINELNTVIFRTRREQRRFALRRAYYNGTIRRSFGCHSAPAVLRIRAGVNDQFIAGLQSISQRFELFLVRVWRRWSAVVHPGGGGLNSEKEQETRINPKHGKRSNSV